MLNTEVFENIKSAWKQILIVTKYWDAEKTIQIIDEAKKDNSDVFYGLWENRIKQIQRKDIPREKMHFIGNIQSKKIPEIVRYCYTIHSLSSLKHAGIIEKQWLDIACFVQIQLDIEKENGISENELWSFIETCKDYKYLKIVWISGMWSMSISDEWKREEFQKLIRLRNTHLPNWLISAGTSIDYEIALKEWIDIVRVGQKAVI